MIIECQICGMTIAKVRAEDLTLPMTGNMFKPHRVGYPSPFLGDVKWMWMKCRYCRRRPFHEPDEVLTPDGIYKVGGEHGPELQKDIVLPEEHAKLRCGACGKEYVDSKNGKVWYDKHIAKCGEDGNDD